ncbi:MAG: hypothetical protein DRJ52_05920 [Thermoprotei archaeon]|nr:MAG: hypothetical protein DRJ52_05920 [Thermoprotei archaeon]RLE99452.1 MAG: hypothetical protein DRJ63_05325 [Thermoprotei archaeon]
MASELLKGMESKPCIAYYRVSTEEQSVEQQRLTVRKFAESRGFMIVREFEEDISGSISAIERPCFKEALAFLEENPGIKILLVYSLDRLGRSFRDIFSTMSNLERKGIMVISVREEFTHIMHPQIRDLIIAILAWVAQYEVYLIRERTRLALQRPDVKKKIAKRRKYDKIDEDKRNFIIELYKKGYSINKIAKYTGETEYIVKKILKLSGVLEVGEFSCPRCFHRLKWDEVEKKYKCRNCGYVKA